MLVACKHIVHKGCAASPVPENKYRIHVERFVGDLLVACILKSLEGAEQAAYHLGQAVFALVGIADMLVGRESLECFPVGSHQSVDRKFVECKSHKFLFH